MPTSDFTDTLADDVADIDDEVSELDASIS
jgi:hypothetical protein